MIPRTNIMSIVATAALVALPASALADDGAAIMDLIGAGAAHQDVELDDCTFTIRTTQEGPAGTQVTEAVIHASDVDTGQVHLATSPDGEVTVQMQLENRQELDMTLHYLGDSAEERDFMRSLPGASCGETGPCSAQAVGYFVASIVVPGDDASDRGWVLQDLRDAIRDFAETC